MLNHDLGVDSRGRGRLILIDRKKNMCELYVDHDSVWVETARLESEVYANAPGVAQVSHTPASCVPSVAVSISMWRSLTHKHRSRSMAARTA